MVYFSVYPESMHLSDREVANRIADNFMFLAVESLLSIGILIPAIVVASNLIREITGIIIMYLIISVVRIDASRSLMSEYNNGPYSIRELYKIRYFAMEELTSCLWVFAGVSAYGVIGASIPMWYGYFIIGGKIYAVCHVLTSQPTYV